MNKNNKLFRSIALLALFCRISTFAFGQTEICSVEELKAIAKDLSGNYKLSSDISLTESWTPIGPFTGTLDGNGHIIIGLKMDQSKSNELGLFSRTENATIKRLGFENAYLNGNNNVAAIVGIMAGGTIEECYVANSSIEGNDHVASIAGKIEKGAIVQNCYATSDIYSRATQAGGLIGIMLNSRISKCYFSGSLRSISDRPGGIVALVNAISADPPAVVEYCVNLAQYIIGPNSVRIIHTGSKTANLIDNYSLSTTLLGGSINSTLSPVPLEDENYGANKMHGANFLNDADAKSSTFYASTLKWDFINTWKMLKDGFPVLSWQNTPVNLPRFNMKNYSLNSTGQVDLSRLGSSRGVNLNFTCENHKVLISKESIITLTPDVQVTSLEDIKIHITNNADFRSVDSTVSIKLFPMVYSVLTAGDLLLAAQYPTHNFKLANDIDMTGITFGGIGSPERPFTGTFDGNGHIVRGLRYENLNKGNVGLFNYTKGATIKKVGIENALFVGNIDVGGIVGSMYGGTVDECFVSANCYIEGRDHVAGIAGSVRQEGVVSNSYAECTVYSREYQVGGIAGIINYGHIEKCYFSGVISNQKERACGIVSYIDYTPVDITDNSVTDCLNLARFILTAERYDSNPTEVFRIIDNRNGALELSNNYSISSTILGKSFCEGEFRIITDADIYYGADNLQGENLKVDADAKTAIFYKNTLGWNFTNVWTIKESERYPTLKAYDK